MKCCDCWVYFLLFVQGEESMFQRPRKSVDVSPRNFGEKKAPIIPELGSLVDMGAASRKRKSFQK